VYVRIVFLVFGIGYAWNKPVAEIKVGDSVTWRWSTPEWVNEISHQVQQTVDATSVDPEDRGFSSGTPTMNGG
jgi:hypothetical protein